MRVASLGAIIATQAAAPALAQEVRDCDTWQANARNVAWATNPDATTRTFANGNIRVTLLDTAEPAAAAVHLLVTYLAASVEGAQECRLISLSGDLGFPSLALEKTFASYNPARGLTLEVPGLTVDGDALLVTFTINRATGEVTVP